MSLRDEALKAMAAVQPNGCDCDGCAQGEVAALDGLLAWLRENQDRLVDSPMSSTVTSRWRLATFTVAALIDLLGKED